MRNLIIRWLESVNIVENRRFFDRTLKKEILPNTNAGWFGGGISREAGSVSRIKRLARFVAGRRGAKCFLPPKLFAEASSPTSPSTIRYTEAHLCSTFFSLSFCLPASLKGILITFFATEVTIRTGSGGWRGYARQRVAQASLCRAGRFLGTSLLPATIFLSPQIFLPISLDNRFDLMAYLISFIYIYCYFDK